MHKRHRLLWFAMPALLLYAVFGIYPLLSAVELSFTSFSGVGKAAWVGLRNYAEVLSDAVYVSVLKVTLTYTVVVVTVQNLLGLLFASLLFHTPRVRSAARVALLVPSMYSA
ncbi:carbohydrate ABC transporter permease, partial [Ralstonia pseudosolanacearum]